MIIQRKAKETHSKELLDQIITYGVNSIEFGSPANGSLNIKGFWVSIITPGGANTEFTINHNLGYIPTGIHIISIDQPSIIYASRKVQWTTKQIFLKANVGSVNLQGFVI